MKSARPGRSALMNIFFLNYNPNGRAFPKHSLNKVGSYTDKQEDKNLERLWKTRLYEKVTNNLRMDFIDLE